MAELLENQIEVGDSGTADGVLLGAGTVWTVNPNSLRGLGLPQVRASDTSLAGASGVQFGPDFRSNKVFEIEAWGKAGTEEAAVALLDSLKRVWAAEPGDDPPLRFRPRGQATRVLFGRPRDLEVDYSLVRVGTAHVLATYASEDWLFYSDDVLTGEITSMVSDSGTSFPLSFPTGFGGSGSTNTISVDNTGNARSYPTLTIYGPITNPKVENLSTGEFIQFAVYLAQGEYLEINMRERTALLGGTASRRGTMAVGSKWWSLLPGTNQLRFSGTFTQTVGDEYVNGYSDVYGGSSPPRAALEARSAWA